MKIKMLQTTSGSIDGVTINKYFAKMEYDLPTALGNAFVDEMGVAKRVSPPKIETAALKVKKYKGKRK